MRKVGKMKGKVLTKGGWSGNLTKLSRGGSPERGQAKKVFEEIQKKHLTNSVGYDNLNELLLNGHCEARQKVLKKLLDKRFEVW